MRRSRERRRGRREPLRNDDGTPTPSNPGFIDALPGPSTATGVPNFIIRKFRVPPFLLPIYQAAGIEYGIRWEVLAAINEIETDYGRNLNVSSAGALGWMQFMPATWKAYGIDANKDGRKDPYNPVDAIFAAARYLKAANYENDVRAAIWAYNHADWYVDSVLLRARLIAGVPADLIGSLTGLTEGRFPVYARAPLRRRPRRAGAAQARAARRERRQRGRVERRSPLDRHLRQAGRPGRGGQRRRGQADRPHRRSSAASSCSRTSTATATRTRTSARCREYYPVPKRGRRCTRALRARGEGQRRRSQPARRPRRAASWTTPTAAAERDRGASSSRSDFQQASAPVKERLFAHPAMEGAREFGGLEQLLDAKARRDGSYRGLQELLLAPVRPRSEQGRGCAASRGARA